jgi:uncharacterized cupredoxin-like copper-binding protein
MLNEETDMRILKWTMVFTVVALIAACGGTGSEVDVSLFEWSVEPTPTSVDAGEVTFTASNDGGEAHEMVVVKGIAPEDLPLNEDGSVNEDALPEDAFVGEVEEIEPGDSGSASFDLEAGEYTIFCNIVETEDDETESHFANGMVSTITVNE